VTTEEKNTRRNQLKRNFLLIAAGSSPGYDSTIRFESEKTHKQNMLIYSAIVFSPVYAIFYYEFK